MSSQDPPADARIRRRSAERREQDKEALRRTILDAAGELFVEGGYEGFSLRRLAERIGYTPTTIYLYFADKDALLLEVVHQGFASFGERLRAAYGSSTDPVQRVEAMGRAYVDFGLAHPASYRLMFLERSDLLLRASAAGGEPAIRSFGVLQQAAAELVASGRVRTTDPQVLAQTLWAGVHGIVALAIATPACDEVQARQITDLYLPAILRGLQADDARSPDPVMATGDPNEGDRP